jgi:2-oxoglutarate dehydrogenase E2 component (dihydrolipoamide succinyltransferase)
MPTSDPPRLVPSSLVTMRPGEIVKRPVVRPIDGQDAILIRPIMHLALSYDHRAVDGAPANGFLYRVKELLEEAEFDL